MNKLTLALVLTALLPLSVSGEETKQNENGQDKLFERALKFVLQWEGGFVDHAQDKGGATNRGITQRTYDVWREKEEKFLRSVKHITDEEVKDIYRKLFWTPAKCPEIAEKCENLAIAHFDWTVNAGGPRAMRTLQECIGTTPDGIWGPKTKKALEEATKTEESKEKLLREYLEGRRVFYRRIVENNPSQEVFLKGWLRRTASLEEFLSKGGMIKT